MHHGPAQPIDGQERGSQQLLGIGQRPGQPRQCDLGPEVRLAMPPEDASRKIKAVAGAWLTGAGMQHVLNGGVPTRREIYLSGEDESDVEELLFAREVRIGLARNATPSPAARIIGRSLAPSPTASVSPCDRPRREVSASHDAAVGPA